MDHSADHVSDRVVTSMDIPKSMQSKSVRPFQSRETKFDNLLMTIAGLNVSFCEALQKTNTPVTVGWRCRPWFDDTREW